MADNIPISDNPVVPSQPENSGRRGLFKRIDDGLNSIFGPINRGMSSIGIQPQSPGQNIMMALSALRPGAVAMPRFTSRAGSQPQSPPSSSDLILQMLQQRANPNGVLQSTRSQQASNPPFRANSFDPAHETIARPWDSVHGQRVLTPANRTPSQEYNLALMRMLQEGGE